MPLHLDYRPKTLGEMIGNASVISAISTLLQRQGDRPRAWLFIGPSGCGKTTLARILAPVLGCHEEDYEELNISDARGIDDARRIINSMSYFPKNGPVRVFCLDEVQQATGPFQQAILKALEDTPSHVVFVLCTTDPQKLLKTIRTRCTTFEVRPLAGPEMRTLLWQVLNKEGLADFPKEAVEEIVKAADGCPREALVILDQVIDIADDQEMIRAIQRSRISEATLIDLYTSLAGKKAWKQVSDLLTNMDAAETDWERLRHGILKIASSNLLKRDDPQAATIIECFRLPFYDSGRAGFVLAAWRALL